MTRKYSLEKVEEEYKEAFFKLHHNGSLPKEYQYYQDMIMLNEKNSSSLLTLRNDCKLYTDAHQKFDDLLIDIKNAKKSIHIAYFIFKTKDQIGQELLQLLTFNICSSFKPYYAPKFLISSKISLKKLIFNT